MRIYLASWKALPLLQRRMVLALLAAVIVANIDQPYPSIAPLHHVPTAGLIVAAPLMLRRWPLSNGAVACIVAFFLLHTLGGRYTYSNVPYDDWSRPVLGVSITDVFGFGRNHYDRFVHFAYGILAVAPVREALMRHAGLGPRIALYVAFECVLAVSCLYEILEWLLAVIAAGPTADAYNGQQGDIWDAQEDMALAALGALIMVGLAWRRRG